MTRMFEERDRGYEAKWAHDEEKHFKILARRNDLLGRWAAGVLGLAGAAAENYAQAVVKAGLAGKGADPVFEKIRTDFAAHKFPYTDHSIHRMMEELFHAASNEWSKREKP